MKTKIVVLSLCLMCSIAFGEEIKMTDPNYAWYKRMEEIAKIRDEEIARAQELKCLELQTRIFAQELELQRSITNNYIDTNVDQTSDNNVDIKNSNDSISQNINSQTRRKHK